MARNLRDIRRKIKAIKATRQVTKAMELVAASKMRRAVQNAQMLRRYALTAWNILENMAEVHPGLHPYLTERPAKKILAILFTSDRGLCGSLNTQMFRMVASYMKETKAMPSFESLSFIAIGKKGQQFLARNNQDVVAAFRRSVTTRRSKTFCPPCALRPKDFLPARTIPWSCSTRISFPHSCRNPWQRCCCRSQNPIS